jgi:toxin CcdB
MARFDVYQTAGALLLDCQADFLGHLDTRFVAPLLPADQVPRADRLNPVFELGGNPFVMATQLASAVPSRELRNPVASLADQHDVILNAFDMLLTGY